MLFAISRASENPHRSLTDTKSFHCGEFQFHFDVSEKTAEQRFYHNEGLWHYTTTTPYIRKPDGSFTKVTEHFPLAGLMAEAENNFVGLELNWDENTWSFIGHSARMMRARLFYTKLENTIVFSYDLRDLLPFTKRKLNRSGAFSILKYGNVPEYITCVEDIYSIPVGMCVKINASLFSEVLDGEMFTPDYLEHYFKLDFPMDGGDIAKTTDLLEKQYEFAATLNPLVPVSGGVDSTLLNCLMDQHMDEPYPAFFMQFGDDDPELKFAKEAAKGTKAELQVGVFTPDDMINSFQYQTEKLIQPVGESSSISIAHYFINSEHKGHNIMDATLADGCYGSVDYTKDLVGGISERPVWQQKMNERVAAFLQWNRMGWENRFHPRDSNMPDPYLQQMDMYLGPFANTIISNADKYCDELLPLWQRYYDYLKPNRAEQDEWMKYSVFKMVNYASKTTTAKSYDNALPNNTGLYPFSWKSILEDQGHYSWLEKSTDGIIKYPLKKILEKYKDHEFIYRKKVGLNSCFEDWIHHPPNRDFLIELLAAQGGIAEHFLGNKRNKLIDKFKTSELHPNLARLVINLTIIQGWMDKNKVTI